MTLWFGFIRAETVAEAIRTIEEAGGTAGKIFVNPQNEAAVAAALEEIGKPIPLEADPECPLGRLYVMEGKK